MYEYWKNSQAAAEGTKLHELASNLIDLGICLPKRKSTLNLYVNDAIGYGMIPEQILYYSDNCFGTADAICFNENKNKLRIHDLKTGKMPASMDQLKIYAALFCLEYRYDPLTIHTELRIYQDDEALILIPDPEEIQMIMDKIVEFDLAIENMNDGVFCVNE